MSEQSITVTDQTTGVEIATRDAKALVGGTVARQIQLVTPVNGGMSTDALTYRVTGGWTDNANANDTANNFISNLSGMTVCTQDKSSVVLEVLADRAAFVSATIIPLLLYNTAAGLAYGGMMAPITLAAADMITENTPGTSLATFPLRKIDTMGADYIGFYFQAISPTTGITFNLRFWAI